MLFQSELAIRGELLLVLGVFNQSLCNLLYDLEYLLLLAHPISICLFHLLWIHFSSLNGVILFLQQLGHVLLQALHLFFQVHYFIIYNLKCFIVIMSIFDLYLDQELVVFTLLCQLLCLVKCFSLLSAYFNRCINIKDWVTLCRVGFGNQLRYLIILLHFDVAIQQKSSVVLVVVSQGIYILDIGGWRSWSFDQLFQVLDQVW